MSLSSIFSPDSREVFVCFLKTVVRYSYDNHTSVAKFSHRKFAKISRRTVRDSRMNDAVRLSHDSLATYFDKNSHKLVHD